MKIDPDGFREKQASEKHHERAEKIKTDPDGLEKLSLLAKINKEITRRNWIRKNTNSRKNKINKLTALQFQTQLSREKKHFLLQQGIAGFIFAYVVTEDYMKIK